MTDINILLLEEIHVKKFLQGWKPTTIILHKYEDNI